MRKIKLISIVLLIIILLNSFLPVIYAVENTLPNGEKLENKIEQNKQKQENAIEQNVSKEDTTQKELEPNRTNSETNKKSNESTVIEENNTNSEEVIFASDPLKNFFIEQYDTNNDGKITRQEISEITMLSIPDFNQTINLQGLEHCIALNSLTIEGTATNYSAISNLPKLNNLNISNIQKQEDYKAITRMQDLKVLLLSSINFIEFNLYELPLTIERLNMYYCSMDSVLDMERFSNLQSLDISNSNTELHEINNLNKLTKLTELALNSVELTDINFLKNNNIIENLSLQGNNLTQIDVIATMPKLTRLNISGNRIEDLSILENSSLLQNGVNFSQNLYIDVNVGIGKIIEVDLPPIMKNCFNPNSSFFEDVRIEIDGEEEVKNCRLNEDKTKVIIDATNLERGPKHESISFYGGVLSGTCLHIFYTVDVQADKEDEIVFAREELKQFLLDGYDIDKDGKITAYDMAQITNLYISCDNVFLEDKIDLQGLEYCVSLESLILYNRAVNYNVIAKLPKLKEVTGIYVDSQEEYEVITKMENLESIGFSNVDFTRLNLYEIPTGIKELELGSCYIDNIENIDRFSNLTKLDISNCGDNLIGIENISKLTKLQELRLSNLNLNNIEFLRNNSTIETLNVAYNVLTDIDIALTMTNLKTIDVAGNQISDLSKLENSELLENSWEFAQSLVIDNKEVNIGETMEIDMPPILRSCFNENSSFYMENIEIETQVLNSTSTQQGIRISEDKTKIIIDATSLPIGKREERLTILGSGRLYYTSIQIDYNVIRQADNIEEVQFASSELKNYMLRNYDSDGDGKITAYDMAQIKSLNISNTEEGIIIDTMINLQGLEYCISLEDLILDVQATNYTSIANLQNLKLLSINHIDNQEDYNVITQLNNLDELIVCDVDFTIYNLYDLPNNLRILRIYWSPINEIQNIERFSNLEQLDMQNRRGENIENSTLQGLEHINNLPKLTNLRLEDMQLENINFLRDNETIEILCLNSNKIKDISVLLTMKKLKEINVAYNRIEDLSVLENSHLKDSIWNIAQNIVKDNLVILRNEKWEIDTPNILKCVFDTNSSFYMPNAEVNFYSYNNAPVVIKLNNDKSKIIIDANQLELGNYQQVIEIRGDGNLDNTRIDFRFAVTENADNKNEIQFDSPVLKNYILDYHDIDGDGKITAYDMA